MGIFGTDDDTREAFALYEKAFGAVKTWEALPHDLPEGNIHLGMNRCRGPSLAYIKGKRSLARP